MNKKDKYKRRSSILKTGKSFSENDEPITPERMEKRVSFAGSKNVKPFASGPENNTVWDTTYEEVVNFTDPTPDHNLHILDITKNSTKNETTTGNQSNVTENDLNSTKNTQTQEMELTNLPEMQNKKVFVKSGIVQCAKLMKSNINDKENFIDSQMDFTCVSLKSVGQDQTTTRCYINKTTADDLDFTKNTQTQEMELTRLPQTQNEIRIPEKSGALHCAKLMKPNISDKENFIDSQMDFTCVSLKSVAQNQTTTRCYINKTTEDDLDFTKNTQTQEMELTGLSKTQHEIEVPEKSGVLQCAKLIKPNISDKENFIDSQMDFTCVKSKVSTTVSSNFEIYTEKDKNEVMEITQNHTLIDTDTRTQVMDFTLINQNKTLVNEKVDKSRKSNLVQYVKSLKRIENYNKTHFYDSKMDFTCAFPKLEDTTRVTNFEIYTEPDVSETQEIIPQQSNMVSSELTLKPEITTTTRVSNFEIYTEPESQEMELQNKIKNISQKSNEIMLEYKTECTTKAEILDKENVPFKELPDAINCEEDFTCEYTTSENVIFEDNYHKGISFDNSVKLISKNPRHAQTILELDFTNQTNLNIEDNAPNNQSNLNEVKGSEENNSKQLNSALFPPEEICAPGNVLFSQKIMKTIADSTPNSSFQMSLPATSPYIDDTQQLIDCTYLKTFSDSTASNKQQANLKENSKFIDPETSIEPDLTNIVLPRSKLSTVNDTYCLKAKSVQDDDSLGVLSTSLMDNGIEKPFSAGSNISLPSLDQPFDFSKYKSRLASFDYKSPKDQSNLITKVNAQTELIRKKIENFQFWKFVSPNFEPFDVKLVYVEQDDEEIDRKSPIELSLHDKILNRQGSQKNWKYQKQDGDSYYFSNLFGNLEFIAHVNETAGLVTNLEIKPVKNTISPIGRFAAKYIIHRMENITSAIGSKYDLLSLLDFVEMTTSNVIDVMVQLDVNCPEVELEFNSEATVATFSVLSFFLMMEFKVSVDISDIDTTNQENVSIDIIMGTNRSEIENLAKDSKKGVWFLPSFICNLIEYVDLREEIYLKK